MLSERNSSVEGAQGGRSLEKLDLELTRIGGGGDAWGNGSGIIGSISGKTGRRQTGTGKRTGDKGET